jgi:hypothetical protein
MAYLYTRNSGLTETINCIPLDCIFKDLPQVFINADGTAMDLVIPAVLVDNFMKDLYDAWVNMP